MKGLPLQRLRHTRKTPHMAKAQIHVGVGVDKLLANPRLAGGRLYEQTQLLMQLTCQRFLHSFTRFDFAAWELPPARIGLTHWALGIEHLPLRIVDYAHRHFGNFHKRVV